MVAEIGQKRPYVVARVIDNDSQQTDFANRPTSTFKSASSMRRYGWFEFEQKPRLIRNYLTGQQLVLDSVVEDSNVANYIGRYSDSEITQSIRFTIHTPPQRTAESKLDIRDLFSGPPTWVVIKLDYRELFSESPSYGLWRRTDDFLIDALLCWPEFLDGMPTCSLHTTGGWRSGAWQPDLRRNFSGRKDGTPDQLTNRTIAEPYVVPLETPAPPAWRLIDVDAPATEANLKFELLVESNVPYLSRSSPIEGFRGLMPFLEREDLAAYIILSKLKPALGRDEDPMTLLYYTYVDQDIFFTFRSHPFYALELGTCIDYGFREFPPRRELWTTKPLGELVPGEQPRPLEDVFSKFSYLSYQVWLRVFHALGDAWSAWGSGSQRRWIEIDKSVEPPSTCRRGSYAGNYGPSTHGGFSAGIGNSWFEVSYPLPSDPR